MNAKLCKLLRRAARKVTVGAPERAYLPRRDARQPVRLDPGSTQGAYKVLKRDWK